MEVARSEVSQVQPTTQSSQAGAPGSVQRAPSTESRPARVRAFSPAVDIFESPEAIVVHVDVPGVTAEDVTLRLEKNELVVKATRHESLHGPIEYQRTFTIPTDIDGEAIAAHLARGVLSLTLPRKASAKPRTIQVRGA